MVMRQGGTNLITNSSCKPLLSEENMITDALNKTLQSVRILMGINYPFRSLLHMLMHPCGSQSTNNTMKNGTF